MAQLRRRPVSMIALAVALAALAGVALSALLTGVPPGLAGTAAALPFTPAAENPVVLSNGPVVVLARGTDGKIWYNLDAGSGWSNWAEVASNLRSSFAAAADNVNMDLVYVAGDGNVWGREFRNGAWGAFYNLGQPAGGTHASSAPALAHGGPGNVHVFVRSADNKLWHRKHTGGGAATGAWAEIAGNLVDAPSAAHHHGRLDVVYRAGDGKVWGRAFADGTWKPWYDLGAPAGGASSGLAIAANADNWTPQNRVSVRSGDGKVWVKGRNGDSWDGNWFEVASGLSGQPAATTRYSLRYDVAYQSGGNIWGRNVWNGNWQDWYNAGSPPGGSSPNVGALRWSDKVILIARSADNKFYARSSNGAAWLDWTPLQSGTASSQAVTPEVSICADLNYGGTCGLVRGDIPNMNDWDPGQRRNDTITSVRVQGGAKAALYEHFGYRGMCINVTASIPDLNTVGFDNRTSSVRLNTSCEDWYVTDIKVSASDNDGQARAGCGDYTLIEQDLNEGAGGASVYLCLKWGPRSEARQTLTVLNLGGRADRSCETGTRDGTDLNQGAGGDFIYFCHTKFNESTMSVNGNLVTAQPLKDVAFDVRSTAAGILAISSDACQSYRQLNQGWGAAPKNGASTTENTDLNRNAGGKYIYPCVRVAR